MALRRCYTVGHMARRVDDDDGRQADDERHLDATLRAVAAIWLLGLLTILAIAYVADRSVDMNATVVGFLVAGVLAIVAGVKVPPWTGRP